MDVAYPNHQYGEQVSSLKGFDFKNKTYPLLGDNISLRNGKYKRDIDGDREDVAMNGVTFFDNSGGQPQHALVSILFFSAGGSSSEEEILLVFALQDGHPTITQVLEFDFHAEGTGEKFDPKTKTLLILHEATTTLRIVVRST